MEKHLVTQLGTFKKFKNSWNQGFGGENRNRNPRTPKWAVGFAFTVEEKLQLQTEALKLSVLESAGLQTFNTLQLQLIKYLFTYDLLGNSKSSTYGLNKSSLNGRTQSQLTEKTNLQLRKL